MHYHVVSNKGVCPVECILLIGATLSRGNDDLVGMFGSGFKHAVLCCLRSNLSIVICCGRTRISFSLKPITLRDEHSERQVAQVVAHFSGDRSGTQELSWTTDMGSMEWDLQMGLREVVANAIDQTVKGGGVPRDVSFSEAEKVRASADETRVFIESSEEVDDFFDMRERWFLQLKENYDTNQRVIDKEEPGKARLYVHGVFVGECGYMDSLFDYNFPNSEAADILDDSRQVRAYGASAAAARLMGSHADPSQVGKFLLAKSRRDSVWEKDFDSWYVNRSVKDSEEAKIRWRAGLAAICGDNPIACNQATESHLRDRGFSPISLPDGMLEVMHEAGALIHTDVLDHDNAHMEVDVTEAATHCLDAVWQSLARMGVTRNKEKPSLKCFEEPSSGGAVTKGFHKLGTDTVWVQARLGGADLTKVMLEEVAHYITQEADCTRSFQDWAFLVAANLMGACPSETELALHGG